MSSKPQFREEPGDWKCLKCLTINFKYRSACFKCSTARDTSGLNTRESPMETGDWQCSKCLSINFESRTACFKCSTAHGTSGSNTREPPMNTRDWKCNNCAFTNFASRTQCRRCNALKQSSAGRNEAESGFQQLPGDWKCPNCPEVNFGSRIVCRSCGVARSSQKQPNSAESKPNDKNECVICMENPIDSVITVCGHSAVCLPCGQMLNQCPICRQVFSRENIIKLFNVHS